MRDLSSRIQCFGREVACGADGISDGIGVLWSLLLEQDSQHFAAAPEEADGGTCWCGILLAPGLEIPAVSACPRFSVLWGPWFDNP